MSRHETPDPQTQNVMVKNRMLGDVFAKAARPAPRELPFLYLHALDGSCIDSGRHGGEWVAVAIAREFRCHPDDVVSVEDLDSEDGREWHSINGQRVAFSVWG